MVAFSKPKRKFRVALERRGRMNRRRIVTSFVVGLLAVALAGIAVGQDHATPQEVVAKVREAAAVLSKGGDVAQFRDKQGPWVWKDTYVWVDDCEKMIQVTHPIRPELNGVDFRTIKDSKGNKIFPANFCDQAKKPSGTWFEYSWPKPGAKEDSRKITYCTSAKGTPYVACAGVYDEKATMAELSKLSAKK
jgi:cytochrome c